MYKRHGQPRRSEVLYDLPEEEGGAEEEAVPDYPVTVFFTREGYLKMCIRDRMYAGGKYGEGEDNYEFSLGLNGLGLCATQYASAWMTADIYRDGFHYHLDFQKGENVGGLHKEPYKGRRTAAVLVNSVSLLTCRIAAGSAHCTVSKQCSVLDVYKRQRLPCSRQRAMSFKNTSVLPLPVTP